MPVGFDKVGPSDWGLVRALFDELVDMPVAERERRLARSPLAGSVVQEVRELLAAADASGAFLEGPGTRRPGSDAPFLPSGYTSLPLGSRVGPFRVEALIGRGGQGEVYRAERADGQFDQIVALKLLRPEAIAQFDRFRAERQILADLEHPRIARLIDGGTAPDGRPYLAMEFVDGEPITVFCGRHALDLPARLGLLREVCTAVAFAHRNLIVHRDLKPGNVLVTRDGAVKLLDFGIARFLEDGQTGALTEAILTPDYAAPEQFEGRRATTETDVYALGAILFELLTGRPPWGGGGALPGVSRLLNDEPPRASRSVRAGAAPTFLPRDIVGDLDAICAKAMRHAPGDRYESVGALSDDIGRYLAFRPVSARQGDAGYRLRRFVRRNRGTLAAGAVTSATLVAGIAAFAWQSRRTGIERAVAREEGARTNAVRQYLMLMLRTAGDEGGPSFGTAKQVLDSTAARLNREGGGPDGSQRGLVRILGELYAEMDDYAGAAPLIERSGELAREAGDAAGDAQARQTLAAVAVRRGQLDEADRQLAAAKAVWSHDPLRFARQAAEAAGIEAGLLRERGEHDRAIALMREAIRRTVAAVGPDGDEIATLHHNLSVHLLESGKLDEGEASLAEASRLLVAQGRTRSTIFIAVLNHRAALAFRRGQIGEADDLWREAIALRRALYGPSTALATMQMNLGRARLVQGKPDEALVVLDEAVPVAAAFAGEDSSVTVMLRQSRALALALVGRMEDAESEIDAALRHAASAFGQSHSYYALGLSVRAQLRWLAGDLPAAKADADLCRAILAQAGDAMKAHLAEVDQLRAMLDEAEAEASS